MHSFQQLADDRQDDMPGWLKLLQRVGVGGNPVLLQDVRACATSWRRPSLREFQRCVVKWSAADGAKDHEVQLLVRLFSKVEIFADGAFDVTRETLPLYNAAVLDVAKFFVLEAQVMNEVLPQEQRGHAGGAQRHRAHPQRALGRISHAQEVGGCLSLGAAARGAQVGE